jgi:aromatase
MKETVLNEIFIKKDPVSVYKVCTEVEKWPDIFPPTKKTKVIEKTNRHIIFEISAETYDGKVETWISKRDIDEEKLTIKFNQIKTVPELKSMEGEWIIEELNDGCKILLRHTYELSDEKYSEVVKKVMDKNSESELNAIKRYLEE